jgi:hypothetical protein
MICSIHQPNYLPYPGFFDKASQSDIFVLYDTTQFEKNSWQNRNRICNKEGWQWLTIPIIHRFGQCINEVQIHNPESSLRKNWNTIKQVYSKAPFFGKYSEIFKDIYSKKYIYLSELNFDLISIICRILGINTKFVKSSQIVLKESGRTQALIEICKKTGADTYLSGISGQNYLDAKLFNESEIKLRFQNYSCPVYDQFNNNSFQPMMSIIDFIFNCGTNDLVQSKDK